jgi:hydrogenase maturation protease
MRARIIGMGQEMAGDDGVGIAVIHRLREMEVPADIELVEVEESAAIIHHLVDGVEPTVLVDAVVGGGSPGRVITLELGAPELARVKLLSTHGIGVLDAIELARSIAPQPLGRIVVVGVAIKRPARLSEGLTRAVAAAVPRAADEALRIAAG